jgi:hypothetical protein
MGSVDDLGFTVDGPVDEEPVTGPCNAVVFLEADRARGNQDAESRDAEAPTHATLRGRERRSARQVGIAQECRGKRTAPPPANGERNAKSHQ